MIAGKQESLPPKIKLNTENPKNKSFMNTPKKYDFDP